MKRNFLSYFFTVIGITAVIQLVPLLLILLFSKVTLSSMYFQYFAVGMVAAYFYPLHKYKVATLSTVACFLFLLLISTGIGYWNAHKRLPAVYTQAADETMIRNYREFEIYANEMKTQFLLLSAPIVVSFHILTGMVGAWSVSYIQKKERASAKIRQRKEASGQGLE